MSCAFVPFARGLDKPAGLALLAFVCLIAVGHLGMVRVGDDLIFAEFGHPYLDFLQTRYAGWTSRIVIEMVLLPFVHLPFAVFLWCNAVIVGSLPFLLARLAAPRAEMETLLLPATCLVLMYPFEHMSGAGWIATCINYLWPLAAALLAVLPLRKLYDGGSVGVGKYAFALLCMVFACSNELLCVAFLILVPAYAVCMGRNCPRIVIVYACVVAASLAVILLCPGNAVRMNAEIATWMPQFRAMSLLQKLYYSYMSLVVPLFFHTNFVMLGLSVVLCVGVFQNFSALPFRLSAVIPILAILVGAPDGIAEQALSATVWKHYGLFVFSFFVIASLSMSLFLLARSVREYCFVMALLTSVFCARGALAFSPTMFASGARTAIFVYAALILATLWAYARIREMLLPDTLTLCRALLAALAVLSLA